MSTHNPTTTYRIRNGETYYRKGPGRTLVPQWATSFDSREQALWALRRNKARLQAWDWFWRGAKIVRVLTTHKYPEGTP